MKLFLYFCKKIQAQSSKIYAIIITDHNYHSFIKIFTRLLILKNGQIYAIKNNEQELAKFGYLPNTIFDI